MFSLVRTDVRPHLEAFLRGGGRKIDAWYATLRVADVRFDDEADAFRNINTAAELAASGNTLAGKHGERAMTAPMLRELSCADDYDPELAAGRRGARS